MSNRLAHEPSPYLQQHAHNPVDWYPWGEEAFRRAREDDRPILLSIGYSSCHWCHVMERESFDDPGVAEIMNRDFVPVKVDREERPDVDGIYMRAVQALTGHGGWPLTVFLTPEGKPFYGGTYFPPDPRHGMPSFRQVLHATADAYQKRRGDVDRAAGELRELLERSTGALRREDGETAAGEGETPALSPDLLDDAARRIMAGFDPVHGGFGSAPKFPQPLVLEFLLRYHRRSGDRQSLQAVTLTLRKLARGGIHDQLGGGFHRYSVDARWLVPHFEKMLYDNALLAGLYVDAFRVTREEELARVARTTLDYLLEDFRSPEGVFYSARDADSEGEDGSPEEGAFYVWTPTEIEAVLGRGEDADLFKACFDVTAAGNFEGKNILHLPHDLEALARARGMTVDELRARLDELGARLLEARARRPAPFRDEKALAGWNGLLLRALAEAGAGLPEERYREAAREGAGFLLDHLRSDGRLRRVWKDGRARIHGFLEDYASLGNALLTLHETTLEPRWLEGATWCADRAVDLFFDEDAGRFFDSPRDGETLVVRPRDPTDTATPSGQSLAVELLLRLGHLLDEERYRAPAVRTLEGEVEGMRRIPSGFGRLLSCLDFHLDTPLELAVVGDPEAASAGDLLGAFHRGYRPNRVVSGGPPDGEDGALAGSVPLLRDRPTKEGRPTAYPCRTGTCRAPVTDPGALEEELRALEGAS